MLGIHCSAPLGPAWLGSMPTTAAPTERLGTNMSGIRKNCSICGNDFEPQFRYQMEERMETGADGRTTVRFAFYCSQRCLDQSHGDGGDNTVACDACAASFQIELASQVLFVGGRRRYACSLDCRAQLQAEARGVR